MRIKVVDTPENLFEFEADVAPRKDEFIYYKDQGYKVSFVCHYIDEEPDTDNVEERYAVVEVAPTELFFSQQLSTHKQKQSSLAGGEYVVSLPATDNLLRDYDRDRR